jgi:hypothetical protein
MQERAGVGARDQARRIPPDRPAQRRSGTALHSSRLLRLLLLSLAGYSSSIPFRLEAMVVRLPVAMMFLWASSAWADDLPTNLLLKCEGKVSWILDFEGNRPETHENKFETMLRLKDGELSESSSTKARRGSSCLAPIRTARSARRATPTRCRLPAPTLKPPPNGWCGRATGRIRQRRKSRTMRSSSTCWRNGRQTRRRTRPSWSRTPQPFTGSRNPRDGSKCEKLTLSICFPLYPQCDFGWSPGQRCREPGPLSENRRERG